MIAHQNLAAIKSMPRRIVCKAKKQLPALSYSKESVASKGEAVAYGGPGVAYSEESAAYKGQAVAYGGPGVA